MVRASPLCPYPNGEIEPDSGEMEAIPGLRIGKLDQEVPATIEGTVFEIVAQGLGNAAKTIAQYHHLLHEIGEHPEDESIGEQLDKLQYQLDQTGGWDIENKVENIIKRVELDGDQEFTSLSGGNKRRALLARALIAEPHILLLTNQPITSTSQVSAGSKSSSEKPTSHYFSSRTTAPSSNASPTKHSTSTEANSPAGNATTEPI